jgi:trimeric autotransporter adhesin
VNAGGIFTPTQTRTYQVTGTCGVPAGAAAVVTQIVVITPPAAGDIEVLPQGGTFGGTVAMVFQANVFSSVSLVARLNQANGQFATQVRGSGGHVAMDVMGYFSAPASTGNGLRVVTLANGSGIPNIINGHSSNRIVTVAESMEGATIGGGSSNVVGDSTGANGWFGTIGGGYGNSVSANFATVAGGTINTASGDASTVAGGSSNIASGSGSFAAGIRANANTDGCIAFSAWSTFTTGVSCFGYSNLFVIGANNGLSVNFGAKRTDGGGTQFVSIGPIDAGRIISAYNGAHLTTGGVWTNASDRAAKENIAKVSARAVLERLVALPVTTWNYIGEGKTVRRMGPMAQDFFSAFGLGQSERSIGTVDAHGVAFAAIQGLNQKLVAESRAKDTKISAQEGKINSLEKSNEAMQRELAAIKKKLGL